MRVIPKSEVYRKDEFEGWYDEYSTEIPIKADWIVSGDWSVPLDILIQDKQDDVCNIWLLNDCLYERAEDCWYWQGRKLDSTKIFKWKYSNDRLLDSIQLG